MIAFPCACGTYRFEVPDDEAGGMIQCPHCKRLNDVPSISDLRALDEDGTLKLADDAPQKTEPGRFNELTRVYGKHKVDQSGHEIDLRQTFDDLRRAGSKDVPLVDEEGDLKTDKPRYDPVTGELIRPIDIKPVAPRPVVPLPRTEQEAVLEAIATEVATGKRIVRGPRAGAVKADAPGGAIHYARRTTESKDIPTLASLPLRLLEPLNLMVMLFVAVGILFVSAFTVPMSGGMFFVAPAYLFGKALILAHYGCCVEEMGPGGQSDLPRPLRDFEFGADMWHPFKRLSFCLFACFGPTFLWALSTDGAVRFIGTGVILLAGAMLFPVMVLVMCASGHAINLRPDRVMGTIRIIGPGMYAWLIVICGLALLFSLASVGSISFTLLVMLTSRASKFLGIMAMAGAGTLVVGVYLSHLATWTLGVLYRRHSAQFPWYFEQHERDRAEDKRLRTLAQIEASRRGGSRLVGF